MFKVILRQIGQWKVPFLLHFLICIVAPISGILSKTLYLDLFQSLRIYEMRVKKNLHPLYGLLLNLIGSQYIRAISVPVHACLYLAKCSELDITRK